MNILNTEARSVGMKVKFVPRMFAKKIRPFNIPADTVNPRVIKKITKTIPAAAIGRSRTRYVLEHWTHFEPPRMRL